MTAARARSDMVVVDDVSDEPMGMAPAVAADTGTTVHVGAPRGGASVLIRIRGALPGLRPAERRVAAAVLEHPATVSESSITTLARTCATSETTVLRFCRAVGLAGYPELRIALARAAQWEEEARGPQAPVTGDIHEADTLRELVAKIIHADARAVEDTESAIYV